jgi:hypothetical protein
MLQSLIDTKIDQARRYLLHGILSLPVSNEQMHVPVSLNTALLNAFQAVRNGCSPRSAEIAVLIQELHDYKYLLEFDIDRAQIKTNAR